MDFHKKSIRKRNIPGEAGLPENATLAAAHTEDKSEIPDNSFNV